MAKDVDSLHRRLWRETRRRMALEGKHDTLEDALCEADSINTDRLAAIEDALCELDERSGGKE